MASGGHDPAKLLRWIIKETAVPNYNNNDSNNNDETNEQKESIPVTKLSELDENEKKKWTDIILGQTPDLLNNRASLQRAIERLHQIKGSIKALKNANDDNNTTNEEIKNCLQIIHHLLDKNEAVLAKLHGVPLLLEIIQNSIDKDNEICLDSCTILHDSTQNNPMMQNHIYSQNGIQILTKTLENCSKQNHKIRAKLWALIHVICRDHNPNFNVFLCHGGYLQISRILRIEQSNITDNLLKEILRISRLLNYMLAVWTDGNEQVFERLNILQSVNWAIYSLHIYVISLVTVSSSNDNDNNNKNVNSLNKLSTAQLILDILMELVGGIRMFMKRDDKCKKFIIANKNNKDITQKLKQLQSDLGAYCKQHRPKMTIKGSTKTYHYCYYKNKNDDEEKKNDEDDDNVNDEDEDEDDPIFLAMKDIWNTIASIIRHVNRYQMHRAEQMKMQEMWRKSLPKHKQKKYANLNKKNHKNKLNKKQTSSPSPPPSLQPQSADLSNLSYQLVLYKKDENKQNDDDNRQKRKSELKKQHKKKRKKQQK